MNLSIIFHLGNNCHICNSLSVEIEISSIKTRKVHHKCTLHWVTKEYRSTDYHGLICVSYLVLCIIITPLPCCLLDNSSSDNDIVIVLIVFQVNQKPKSSFKSM